MLVDLAMMLDDVPNFFVFDCIEYLWILSVADIMAARIQLSMSFIYFYAGQMVGEIKTSPGTTYTDRLDMAVNDDQLLVTNYQSQTIEYYQIS